MTAPSELADRVERADGPSRELDVEIALAIGWRLDQSGPNDLWREPGRADWVELPEFTASLDAALTLLGPPGHPLWTYMLHGRSHGQHGMTWTAEVTVPSREFQGYSGAGAALALCAAALRARAREGE